ncbi:hypothetical protein SynBIOSE41_03989 [Synechococcus sp. BIOS-E4-1]|nr:hypothetical protein [Synechococcus sp. BIOS-E4-1]QNI56454.1 hypothetical protein SynBIOSE41_03989 [Synechococcus sp. BIOS-E4-1]
MHAVVPPTGARQPDSLLNDEKEPSQLDNALTRSGSEFVLDISLGIAQGS